MADYVPEAGDVVWLRFDPQAGRGQAGHRPAVVLGPATYNRLSGMMICCPTTSRIKGYPSEVAIAGSPPSVVLADQAKSQDWGARQARRKGRVSAKLRALIGCLHDGRGGGAAVFGVKRRLT